MTYSVAIPANADSLAEIEPDVIVYGLEGEIAALLTQRFSVDGNFTRAGKITSHFPALDDVSGNAANLEYATLYPELTY